MNKYHFGIVTSMKHNSSVNHKRISKYIYIRMCILVHILNHNLNDLMDIWKCRMYIYIWIYWTQNNCWGWTCSSMYVASSTYTMLMVVWVISTFCCLNSTSFNLFFSTKDGGPQGSYEYGLGYARCNQLVFLGFVKQLTSLVV